MRADQMQPFDTSREDQCGFIRRKELGKKLVY